MQNLYIIFEMFYMIYAFLYEKSNPPDEEIAFCVMVVKPYGSVYVGYDKNLFFVSA